MARKQHPEKKQFLVVWHCRDGARGCCTVLTSTSTALPPFTCLPNRQNNGDVALCSIQTKKKGLHNEDEGGKWRSERNKDLRDVAGIGRGWKKCHVRC